ncbi:group II intron reverse transcriptase/maturase [Neochlamydia sp. AcF84]|uniref:group II intron reverse transcriptase/maturase n=2 Tax=unclassified Neochlamydia TaxID=2643326 RepID=UPI00325BD8F7
MSETKPFIISKTLVMEAYKLVKANAGAAGIDQQTLEGFDRNLKSNLYKIWNRMSSGSYFPPPVKAVAIPKKSGGERILGIPTVSDRIAQMIVKLMFEPTVEPHFHQNSYGYRPNRSALDAVGITRQRCWKYDWVLEFDIKGLFDNIDHSLLMKAVRKHTDNKWVILYIERWLKAPLQLENGTLVQRTKGTPQGGVISPVLANLFLHYVFDAWMTRDHPDIPWCRYADDALVHCKTEQEAKQILHMLEKRMEKCSLTLHPDKTKIVYCKDVDRKGKYKEIKFDFLGYTFRPRVVKNSKRNSMFVSFTPAVSKTALKSMQATIRQWNIRNQTGLELKDIARMYNPIIRGWLEYYGRYRPAALYQICRHFNKSLITWAMRKYKRLAGHKTRAITFMEKIVMRNPGLFVHWKRGMIGAFA